MKKIQRICSNFNAATVLIIASFTIISFNLRKVEVATDDYDWQLLAATNDYDWKFFPDSLRRLGRDVTHATIDLSKDNIDEEVCITFPKIHDESSDYVEDYYEKLSWLIEKLPAYDRDMPKLKVMKDGARFAIWGKNKGLTYPPIASAWEETNGKTVFVNGPGWTDPDPKKVSSGVETQDVEGSFVGFASTFPNNYGHLIHDHIPLIAWLLTKVPSTTKFILHYDPKKPVAQHVYKLVDESFMDRVLWVPYNHIVHVKRGDLTVIIPDKVPTYMGTSFMKPLRKWLTTNHPEEHIRFDTDHPHGLVIYYTRSGASNVEHGRVIEKSHERDIVEHIKEAMKRHGRKEDFITYSGFDNDGNSLSVEDQFHLFRSATAVIGPHGSGLANMVWFDFKRAGSSCEKRPNVLEFVSGPDSEQVQHVGGKYLGYSFLFRGLPMDYHNILYTSESSAATTYIHIEALDLALDDMWGQSQVE